MGTDRRADQERRDSSGDGGCRKLYRFCEQVAGYRRPT